MDREEIKTEQKRIVFELENYEPFKTLAQEMKRKIKLKERELERHRVDSYLQPNSDKYLEYVKIISELEGLKEMFNILDLWR